MHRNPNLFPDPDAFDPCRWLNPVTAKRLEKCLVYFSRGSTQCVGMQYVLPLSFPFTFLPLSLPLHYSVQSSTPNKIHNHKISLQCTIKLQGLISQASHISSYTSASEPFFVHSKTCGSLRRRRKIWSLMIFSRRVFQKGRGRLGWLVRCDCVTEEGMGEGFGREWWKLNVSPDHTRILQFRKGMPQFPRVYAVCESEPILVRAGINVCSAVPRLQLSVRLSAVQHPAKPHVSKR